MPRGSGQRDLGKRTGRLCQGAGGRERCGARQEGRREGGNGRAEELQAGRPRAKRARRAFWRLAVSFLMTPFAAVRSRMAVAWR